jgi:hypothetical protein
VVRSVLAQRLFVEKAGLTSPHLNQIKRLAAFQNPEFYKKQRLRLSSALTPRVIACAEDLPDHVALPRGCREDLEELLRGFGGQFVVDDRRQPGEPLDLRFEGTLHLSRNRPPRGSWLTTLGSSWRLRASARLSSGPTSSRPEPGPRWSWSTASRS